MSRPCNTRFRGAYIDKRRLPPFFIGCLLLALPALSHGEIYKWVDENGRTHYGDKPPKEDATRMKISKQPAADADYNERQEKQKRLLNIYDEERKEKKEKLAKKAEEEKKRKVNCTKATKDLQGIKNASFLYEDTDDPKNPRILSNEERNKETAKAEAQVKQWCK